MLNIQGYKHKITLNLARGERFFFFFFLRQGFRGVFHTTIRLALIGDLCQLGTKGRA